MFGKIVYISDNMAHVEIPQDKPLSTDLMNMHVVFEDEDKKILGEVEDISSTLVKIRFLGEITANKFIGGVLRKPKLTSNIRLVREDEVKLFLGSEGTETFLLGTSPLYNGFPIRIDINALCSNHMAIFGNSGSGKSCGVARILQNLFGKTDVLPYKSNFFIFDAYGEYHNAFKDLHKKVPEINFKAYTTNVNSDTELLRIPIWLLDTDDIAILLGVEKPSQIPIIEKALKLVTIFGREESVVLKHKNDIIARAILEILSSGRQSTQIRDQIFSVLTRYNTSELNLETKVFQPGYVRSLKQCLLIDSSGKMREMELLVSFIEKFLDDSLELKMPDKSFKYTLKDLKEAFDFALISEGILKSDKIFDEVNTLKVRLHSLINSDYSKFFEYDNFITEEAYIKELLSAPNNRKAQLINFNINYVDDRFAKALTKIYSKMLFNYSKDNDQKTSLPFHIVLEEAHRYVQNDNDINILGYNIFDRITKEGRKYGVMLGLISQRPSELSETSLSQCSNFLIFKMLHPKDISYIQEMVPNITTETVEKIRILQPGNCIAFGSAFKIPVLVKFEMPSPAPTSESCDITNTWFLEKE